MNLPEKNIQKLSDREQNNALRELGEARKGIDFSSNDYLGLSRSASIFHSAHDYLIEKELETNGSSGSRLLSGNHSLYKEIEALLCKFHNSESALIFNSGYDANLGFFSSVPQRGDVILFDELVHASIRDGILMSNAKSYKFNHNDLDSLAQLFQRVEERGESFYVVTESVFSMDGDEAILKQMAAFCFKNKCHLVVDEAHAVGVFGEQGEGKVQELGLENEVFARIITFGKSLGAHGAAILGNDLLKKYLVNFARSFIYTTALPPHSLATLKFAYHEVKQYDLRKSLLDNITFFKQEANRLKLEEYFIESNSPIQSFVISGNKRVKNISTAIHKNGFDVKPILSPTVAKGQERLRFCIHSYNSQEEISRMLELLATFVFKGLL